MPISYNRISGQSLERLAALSDGIFAVAMTLLVLDLHVPLRSAVVGDAGLCAALWQMTPQIVAYGMSFLTLGIFWHGQQVQLKLFRSSDRYLSWLHVGFLFAVTLMPFSTRLLAEFMTFRTALIGYWLNIVLLGGALFVSWRYAGRRRLLDESVSKETQCAVERRIVVAQALYALGALLCLWSNYASIALIVLVQLNFALAPRVGWLSEV